MFCVHERTRRLKFGHFVVFGVQECPFYSKGVGLTHFHSPAYKYRPLNALLSLFLLMIVTFSRKDVLGVEH